MSALTIEIRWIPLESEPGKPYLYPLPPTKYMKQTYSQPGVYRWAVFGKQQDPWSVYIGEAEDLVKRLSDYLKPGSRQQTNLRIKQYLDERLKVESRIEFHRLEFNPFSVNGISVSLGTCHKSTIRKFLENLAILEHEQKLCTVMNRTADVKEKKRTKAALHLAISREELDRILKNLEGH